MNLSGQGRYVLMMILNRQGGDWAARTYKASHEHGERRV